MKLKSSYAKILLFCLVFVVLIIPPLFERPDLTIVFENWHFPLPALCLFIFSLFLIYINKELFFHLKKSRYQIFYNFLFPLTLCFCSLFAVSLLIQGLSLIFKNSSNNVFVAKPDAANEWFFCIMQFLFSAFYEEIIYRFYFPDFLLSLIQNKNIEEHRLKFCKAGIEISACILFSLAHFYAGIFAVFCHALFQQI